MPLNHTLGLSAALFIIFSMLFKHSYNWTLSHSLGSGGISLRKLLLRNILQKERWIQNQEAYVLISKPPSIVSFLTYAMRVLRTMWE